mgnify:CR=1 FL=1
MKTVLIKDFIMVILLSGCTTYNGVNPVTPASFMDGDWYDWQYIQMMISLGHGMLFL